MGFHSVEMSVNTPTRSRNEPPDQGTNPSNKTRENTHSFHLKTRNPTVPAAAALFTKRKLSETPNKLMGLLCTVIPHQSKVLRIEENADDQMEEDEHVNGNSVNLTNMVIEENIPEQEEEEEKTPIDIIEKTLDDVIKMLKEYSNHTVFPETLTRKVNIITKKLMNTTLQEQNERPNGTSTTLTAIAESIVALHTRMDNLKNSKQEHGSRDTPLQQAQVQQPPVPTTVGSTNNNFATSALIKP